MFHCGYFSTTIKPLFQQNYTLFFANGRYNSFRYLWPSISDWLPIHPFL